MGRLGDDSILPIIDNFEKFYYRINKMIGQVPKEFTIYW